MQNVVDLFEHSGASLLSGSCPRRMRAGRPGAGAACGADLALSDMRRVMRRVESGGVSSDGGGGSACGGVGTPEGPASPSPPPPPPQCSLQRIESGGMRSLKGGGCGTPEGRMAPPLPPLLLP
eukprot:100164-Chlamydomonas_euryale.AAC.1